VASNDLADVESLIDAPQSDADVFGRVRKAFESNVGKDRSAIAKRLVWLYIFSIGATVLYLITFALWTHANEFGNISELIKIAVVPVITLVLGYYFGSHRPE